MDECDVSDLKNKNVLIAGANGLIGGILSDFINYLNENYSYNIKLILLSLSENPNRIKHLLNKQNIKYFSQDLSKGFNGDYKIDYCFYCAGYAQPLKFIRNNTSTFFLNTIGLQQTFENIFKKNKNAKCVFLSSSEVYAINENKSLHEESDIINILVPYKRNFYLMGKLSGEIIVNNFRKLGYNAKSVRVSTTYGPGHSFDDKRVLSELTKKAFSKLEYIELFDDGSAFRKYQYVSDCCIMLFNILINGKSNVYNIGGKEEVTIYDIATIIADKFGKKVVKGVANNEVVSSAPKRVSISLNRYKEEFGEFEVMSFKDGMENYLNWYKEELEI